MASNKNIVSDIEADGTTYWAGRLHDLLDSFVPMDAQLQPSDTRVTDVQLRRQNLPPPPTLRGKPDNQPHYSFARVDDSQLRRQEMPPPAILQGTPDHSRLLMPSFRARERPKRFFCIGRVFLALWVESIGSAGDLSTRSEPSIWPGIYENEFTFSKVRRFVVIREGDRDCTAVPITTYSNRGVARVGATKCEHCIVYTGREPPNPQYDELPARGERGMVEPSIRLVLDEPTAKLSPMSRLNLVRVCTIEHDMKVRPLGMVHQTSMPALLSHLSHFWDFKRSLAVSPSFGSIPESRRVSLPPEKGYGGSNPSSDRRQGTAHSGRTPSPTPTEVEDLAAGDSQPVNLGSWVDEISDQYPSIDPAAMDREQLSAYPEAALRYWLELLRSELFSRETSGDSKARLPSRPSMNFDPYSYSSQVSAAQSTDQHQAVTGESGLTMKDTALKIDSNSSQTLDSKSQLAKIEIVAALLEAVASSQISEVTAGQRPLRTEWEDELGRFRLFWRSWIFIAADEYAKNNKAESSMFLEIIAEILESLQDKLEEGENKVLANSLTRFRQANHWK